MPLGAAVLSVRHVGLSGWSQPECAALENELTAWQQAGKFQERDQALRCSVGSPLSISCCASRQHLDLDLGDAGLMVVPMPAGKKPGSPGCIALLEKAPYLNSQLILQSG